MSDIISQFDLFWTTYPRKIGKGDARKAWRGGEKKVGGTFIVAALMAQLNAGAFDKDRQFIPYPATWLRAERWDDEIVVSRPTYRNGATALAAEMAELSRLNGGAAERLEGPAGE